MNYTALRWAFDAQFLIEPKPREPTKHQYDYDAQTVMGFLQVILAAPPRHAR